MINLAIDFLKIGLLTFGGGSSVSPLIYENFVERRKSITNESFMDIVMLANMLPGPSMIQMATAVGFKLYGYKGAIISGLMISMPSIFLFVIAMALLQSFIPLTALIGIVAPLFIVMSFSLATTVVKLAKPIERSVVNILIVVATFVAMYYFKINAGLLIIIGIVIGLITAKEKDVA